MQSAKSAYPEHNLCQVTTELFLLIAGADFACCVEQGAALLRGHRPVRTIFSRSNALKIGAKSEPPWYCEDSQQVLTKQGGFDVSRHEGWFPS